MDAYDYLLKFIVIGDTGTGKSCILHQFLHGKFKKGTSNTIGVEFGSKIVQVAGKTVKLQIWDTAGQERFRSVTRSYYRGAAGCLIVYDTSNRDTYNRLPQWLNDARQLASESLTIMVVGNKIDLKEDREVTFLEASRFALDNNLLFMECSALTGQAVEEVFLKSTKGIVSKIDQGEIDPNKMVSGIQYGGMSQPLSQAVKNQTQMCC